MPLSTNRTELLGLSIMPFVGEILETLLCNIYFSHGILLSCLSGHACCVVWCFLGNSFWSIMLQEVEADVKARTKGEMGAAKTLCSPFDQPELPEGIILLVHIWMLLLFEFNFTQCIVKSFTLASNDVLLHYLMSLTSHVAVNSLNEFNTKLDDRVIKFFFILTMHAN